MGGAFVATIDRSDVGPLRASLEFGTPRPRHLPNLLKQTAARQKIER
jgi:hypothetical protein